MRDHGSNMAHSYNIRSSEGKSVLRPRKHVRVLAAWGLKMVRKLDAQVIQRVRFGLAGPAAGESREQRV